MFEILGAIALVIVLFAVPRTVGICVVWNLLIYPHFWPEGINSADMESLIFVPVVLVFVVALVCDGFSLVYNVKDIIRENSKSLRG